MSDAARVSVVIVDDHAMFRRGVRAELGDAVEVLAEAADVDEAIAAVSAHHPDVVLLDVHLPGGGGVEVMRRLAASPATGSPDTRFLALSVSDAAEDVIGTIRGGARATSPRPSPGPSWSGRSSGWPTATPCSPRAWPASCWTRSRAPSTWPRSTRTSTG
jgi:CheY-like chemotaxis protein